MDNGPQGTWSGDDGEADSGVAARRRVKLQLVRQGRYKYVRTLVEEEMEELYDLQADPGERRNLAVEAAYRRRLLEFRAKLDAELRRTGGEKLAANLPAPREVGS